MRELNFIMRKLQKLDENEDNQTLITNNRKEEKGKRM